MCGWRMLDLALKGCMREPPAVLVRSEVGSEAVVVAAVAVVAGNWRSSPSLLNADGRLRSLKTHHVAIVTPSSLSGGSLSSRQSEG